MPLTWSLPSLGSVVLVYVFCDPKWSFGLFLLILWKKCNWYFNRISLKLWIALSRMGILIISVIPIHETGKYLLYSSWVLVSLFYSLHFKDLSLLCLKLFLRLWLFLWQLNEISFLTSLSVSPLLVFKKLFCNWNYTEMVYQF